MASPCAKFVVSQLLPWRLDEMSFICLIWPFVHFWRLCLIISTLMLNEIFTHQLIYSILIIILDLRHYARRGRFQRTLSRMNQIASNVWKDPLAILCIASEWSVAHSVHRVLDALTNLNFDCWDFFSFFLFFQIWRSKSKFTRVPWMYTIFIKNNNICVVYFCPILSFIFNWMNFKQFTSHVSLAVC